MQIYLYNTLTKNKDEFLSITKNMVKMYSCGPTVYNRAHIGNLKTYVFNDMLRKLFKYNGYDVYQVMNITDVGHLVSDGDTGEDKMILAARREGKTPEEIAKYYEELFFEDTKLLNIDKPEKIIRATDEIKEMENYVKKLLDKGFAYETTNTIYFDTSKLDKYGLLSKIEKDETNVENRIEYDLEKRNKTDFALWIKAPKNHIMKWDSFFGLSYPGWHLECSVISEKYLGKPFDVHTGGIDHIQYHHENEIAQSKGHSGEIPANYWIHSGFLVVDNTKMSKSLGNVYYVSDLISRGYSALDFRYFLYSSNYRNKTNFTFEALDSAKIALNRLKNLFIEHNDSKDNSNKYLDKKIIEWEESFNRAINDDLNTTVALSYVWEAARNDLKSKKIANLLLKFDEFLSLDIDKIDNNNNNDLIPKDILELKIKRDEARNIRDYKLADELRDKILDSGYDILDKENESILIKKE